MLGFYLAFFETQEEKTEFENIYYKYRQDMYKIAFNILRNEHDAEDAVHEAFIKIADNIGKINKIPCQELKSYIVIIIRNVSIDFYRRNKKHAERISDISEAVTDDTEIFEQYDYRELAETISRLPVIYKDVLFLRYIEGFSGKEISDMLGISTSAVWKRLERAKKMLKKYLERED